MLYNIVVNDFANMSKRILGDNLVGVYLHGSAAMGCFHPKTSDLDLIVVVEEHIADAEKLDFMREVVRLDSHAPAKGIEMSIVRRKFCRPFVYPTPYELHFSKTHLSWFLENPRDYVAKMQGTDPDLAAHFTILKKYGDVLCGEPIDTVFGEVPADAYTDSICRDIWNAPEEITDNPVYMTLNLCRVLAWLREGAVCSKQEGGKWGLAALPGEFQPLLTGALQSYETGEEMEIEPEACRRFAAYMKEQIRQFFSK